MLLPLVLSLTQLTAIPIVVDPDIQSNEIAVYFDQEKWQFTVVAVVSALEIREHLTNGHKYLVLDGKIGPERDIGELLKNRLALPELAASTATITNSTDFIEENLATVICIIIIIYVAGAATGFSTAIRYEDCDEPSSATSGGHKQSTIVNITSAAEQRLKPMGHREYKLLSACDSLKN